MRAVNTRTKALQLRTLPVLSRTRKTKARLTRTTDAEEEQTLAHQHRARVILHSVGGFVDRCHQVPRAPQPHPYLARSMAPQTPRVLLLHQAVPFFVGGRN